MNATLLLPLYLVGELPNGLPVLAEQVKVVLPLLVGSERGGTEHLVEDVQDEPASGIRRDVEVRPVVLRRLDQETEVPSQQFQRDPVLVVDRRFVDPGQPVEQALGERGCLLGGFERPVREVGHRLTAAELDGRALVGDERRVLVADGGDER